MEFLTDEDKDDFTTSMNTETIEPMNSSLMTLKNYLDLLYRSKLTLKWIMKKSLWVSLP